MAFQPTQAWQLTGAAIRQELNCLRQRSERFQASESAEESLTGSVDSSAAPAELPPLCEPCISRPLALRQRPTILSLEEFPAQDRGYPEEPATVTKNILITLSVILRKRLFMGFLRGCCCCACCCCGGC